MAGLSHVPRVPARVRRSGGPALPRPAQRLSGLRAAGGIAGRRGPGAGVPRGRDRRGRGSVARRPDRGGQGPGRISSDGGCRQRGGRARAAPPQASRGETAGGDVSLARVAAGRGRAGRGRRALADLRRRPDRARAPPRADGGRWPKRWPPATRGSARCCPTPRCTCCCSRRSGGRWWPRAAICRRSRSARTTRRRGGGWRAIADLFLVHDRPIARPVDDSVVRRAAGGPVLLRRARGFAPAPLRAAAGRRDPRSRCFASAGT